MFHYTFIVFFPHILGDREVLYQKGQYIFLYSDFLNGIHIEEILFIWGRISTSVSFQSMSSTFITNLSVL